MRCKLACQLSVLWECWVGTCLSTVPNFLEDELWCKLAYKSIVYTGRDWGDNMLVATVFFTLVDAFLCKTLGLWSDKVTFCIKYWISFDITKQYQMALKELPTICSPRHTHILRSVSLLISTICQPLFTYYSVAFREWK